MNAILPGFETESFFYIQNKIYLLDSTIQLNETGAAVMANDCEKAKGYTALDLKRGSCWI